MTRRYRRCRIEDIRNVAETLGESLAIQLPYVRPVIGAGALLLTKNATDTRWWQSLARSATAICFPTGRLTETTTMQGPSLFYFGEQVEMFIDLCQPFGHCWQPIREVMTADAPTARPGIRSKGTGEPMC
jgi:hypothetical protein